MPADRRIWEVSLGPSNPLGHEQLTVGTSAVGLPNIPAGTRRVLLRVVNQPVNWTDFPDDPPTATFGMPLLKDESLVFDGDPENFRLIRASSATADADVRVAYYGND